MNIQSSDRYRNLIGATVTGFEVEFADGLKIVHEGRLIPLKPMVVHHGRIVRADAF